MARHPVADDGAVEFRCPVRPARMFGRLVDGVGEGQQPATAPGLLLDYRCDDCTRAHRDVGVRLVTHQFALDGQWVSTARTHRDGRRVVTPARPERLPGGAGRRDDERAAGPSAPRRRPR